MTHPSKTTPERAHQDTDPLVQLRDGEYGFYVEAKRSISQGDIVFQLDGQEVDEPHQHTIQLSEHIHYGHARGLWRFTQHACEPNLRFDTTLRAMIAVRDISLGEELNYNYNSSEWAVSAPFICACGAMTCAREVKGFTHLSLLERERLRPLLTTYLLSHLSGVISQDDMYDED